MGIKINEVQKVIYVALNKTVGLVDLELQPYDEAGVAFGVPIAFVELANGSYEASFTPDAVGDWRVRVASAANGDDAIKSFKVISTKLDDVKTVVDSVETKVDVVDTVVDSIETKVDTIDAVVDATKVVVDSVEAKTDVIDGVVDAIKVEADKIQAVDDNVDAVKAKTDNLPVDTAQELSDIDAAISGAQADIDDIKANVTPGGYFA